MDLDLYQQVDVLHLYLLFPYCSISAVLLGASGLCPLGTTNVFVVLACSHLSLVRRLVFIMRNIRIAEGQALAVALD